MITYVNFEIAKLLKEKGFNLYCVWSYWKGERTHHTPGYALEDGTTSQENYWDFERHYAPTIAEAVMWLYEKHGIWIVVNITIDDRWYFELYNLKDKRNSEILVDYKDVDDYQATMEASYEAAILYTLNNLI